MIVEPDFLDHWKTRLLVQRTNDESAPLMILRLWAHCQSRKKWKFENMTDEVLVAICRAKPTGYPQVSAGSNGLRSILIDCGFARGDNGTFAVHDWEVTNKSLINSWNNGSKGGRPRKNPRVRVGKPTVTHGQPTPLSYLSILKEGVQKRFTEWIAVRKAMGKAPKNWDAMFLEQAEWLTKFNEPDQIEIISASIRNNWQGLFPPKQRGNGKPQPPQTEWKDIT